jgi:putative hemolysin
LIDLILALALSLLIAASAFLAASETSLFSLSSFSLRSYRNSADRKQRLVASLMDRPRDVLITVLILNVVSNLLIQNTVSTIFDAFPIWTLKVGLPLVLVLVLGEIIPKSIALPNNVQIATKVAPIIGFLMQVFKPILSRLNAWASLISRFLFFFLREEEEATTDELRHVVKTSLESGVLSAQESELIEGALDLKESIVKELMRPRDEVLFYDIQEPLAQLYSLFVEQKCSRVPICDGQLDRIVGILSIRRFFFHQDKIHSSRDLMGIIKKPYFVPESTQAWSLLLTLREIGENMAIVVDEYGSISGLITQEDLIETVVGDIADRRDEKSLYTRSGPDVIIASGKLELCEFEDLFQVHLPTKEHPVTLGGWLIEQLGDIPAAGTRYAMDDFLFYVLAADPNRIRRIYVRRIRSPKKKGAPKR